MSKRRVVVTGLGIVSPVGSQLATAWENILAGRSGITAIEHFDASASPVRISAAVRDFRADDYIPVKDQKKMDIFVHYGVGASIQAIRDAGLEDSGFDPERVGVSVGSGIGGLPGIEKGHTALLNGGARKVSPFFIPSSIINMVSGNLSIMYGFRGPNTATVTACTTGTHNIGLAARMIAYGDADVMIAGGAEMASTPLCVAGFAAARALSTRNDDPAGASRPWDSGRDGFVLGDGAGVLVLEEYAHAKARGAHIYCELAGFGLNADAHHMTQPSPSGEGAARCMQRALADAGVNPAQIDYVNAHGTSTPAGDKAETAAMKLTFGDHAYKLAISSTKSMTGHLLGAAGGVEAVFCVLALRDQVVPPTINLDDPDPECDLDYVPHEARQTTLNCVLSNSFGFGGTNGTLLFKTL
ncbi:beta-ketoacyl-ACP synthase II [Acidihalobacter ferrooxydans]|uniref:3-oxoacyl-[acyl-carrier-protein] synthase 2 n=1 Tax=Acidihalobacter ferrooxydans TaxID=1765967 RepID=A0A1P8UII6_9GAMM|nr:beta-ketoacyl-ACP synthase II [Acidihalobacter ferrooxydans]APZ43648.1 beta-ketoacyl-[acyl-carrier-protein] synthase II [Acidihalobacter ferrooxydans]